MNTESSESPEGIDARVRAYIVENFLYNRGDVELSDDLRLFDAGIIDSMGLIRLIGFLGETFGIRIEPDEVLLENFETLNAIKTFILGKQAAVQPSAGE